MLCVLRFQWLACLFAVQSCSASFIYGLKLAVIFGSNNSSRYHERIEKRTAKETKKLRTVYLFLVHFQNSQPATVNTPEKDFSSYPFLHGPPRVGDIVAYKVQNSYTLDVFVVSKYCCPTRFGLKARVMQVIHNYVQRVKYVLPALRSVLSLFQCMLPISMLSS